MADRSSAAHVWDAGDLGCGELIMRLRADGIGLVEPGDVLCVVARDPGAMEDLPAWCGLTGHELVAAAHPDYWIRRKK